MADKKIKVKLVKSINGCKTGHVATVRGLGLRRLNHVVELVDTAGSARHDQPRVLPRPAGELA